VLLAVLQAMLDERGIRSPDATVSARAAYLFLRIVKPLRSQIAPHAVTVLQSLSEVMGTADGEGLDWSEREHLYEAAGLLAASHEDAVGMLEAVLVSARFFSTAASQRVLCASTSYEDTSDRDK